MKKLMRMETKMEIKEVKVKTVQVTFSVKTGISNIELCDFVERILTKSVLGSCEYSIDVTETKVIRSEC